MTEESGELNENTPLEGVKGTGVRDSVVRCNGHRADDPYIANGDLITGDDPADYNEDSWEEDEDDISIHFFK